VKREAAKGEYPETRNKNRCVLECVSVEAGIGVDREREDDDEEMLHEDDVLEQELGEEGVMFMDILPWILPVSSRRPGVQYRARYQVDQELDEALETDPGDATIVSTMKLKCDLDDQDKYKVNKEKETDSETLSINL